MTEKATIFKSFKDTNEPHYITIDVALQRIKFGKSKITIEKLRGETDEKKQKSIKNSLPCICFAGKFKRRNDEDIIEHSGFIVLDFDKIENVPERMELFKNDKYVYSAWISPRGNGIKVLIKIPPDISSHREYFLALLDRYPDTDRTSINISRICFESYDPEIFINENSEIWDQKKIEKVEIKKIATKDHKYEIVNVAAKMIRGAADGEKHAVLLKAAKLIGGYVAIGKVDQSLAETALEFEIKNKNIDDIRSAMQTIRDGIEYGMQQPISEAIKIERESRFIKDERGKYVFLASEIEMDDYLYKYYHGKIEMGLSTKINGLDPFFRFKKNTFVLFIGIDNVGKSTVVWYLALLSSLYYGWKCIIYSSENDDNVVKRKIFEFLFCKRFRELSKEELNQGNAFYLEHFRIISSRRDIYTCINLIEMAQVVIETEFKADLIIMEPYNSFKLDTTLGLTKYDYNLYCLSELRLFSQRYCSVWCCCHTVTEAARNVDGEGNARTPLKSMVEGGQSFANRADDIVILHRKTKSPDLYKITEINIDKVKDHDTGGRPTPFNEPIKIKMVDGNCGFVDNETESFNPVLEHKYAVNNIDFIEPGKFTMPENKTFDSSNNIDFSKRNDNSDIPF